MKKNSKILSFLIVVVAIFTLVLFTKNEFSNFQQKTDQKEQLQAQVQAKQ
jgi:large-conductance mechanosensitive channel